MNEEVLVNSRHTHSKSILYGSREDLLKEIVRLNGILNSYKNQCKVLELSLSSQISSLKSVSGYFKLGHNEY